MKKVAYIPKEFDGQIASTGFCVLRPIQEKLHSKYLFYFLLSDQLLDQVLPLQRGVSYPAIRDNDLKNAHIPIPPIDEQNKIVELLEDHLSRLDAALADVKKAKLKAAQFRRSLLKSTFEEFGEHSIRIGDVVTFNRRKPAEFKNSKSEVSFVPMPKVSEVSGQIVLDESISHSEGQRRSLTYFENGDVIFAKITPCMENGKIALAKNLFNGAAYGSTEFHVLTPTERIHPDYLRYFIGSDDFRANAERAMTGAVGQRRVPKTYLDDHAIPLPSLEIQTEIVAHLDSSLSRTDDAIKVAEKIETESARLRRALLQSAFTGQLTKEVVSV
jgi:type I restriction enzyme S subunit